MVKQSTGSVRGWGGSHSGVGGVIPVCRAMAMARHWQAVRWRENAQLIVGELLTYEGLP
jgi:hypothetical protein